MQHSKEQRNARRSARERRTAYVAFSAGGCATPITPCYLAPRALGGGWNDVGSRGTILMCRQQTCCESNAFCLALIDSVY